MEQEKKNKLIGYTVNFVIASVITLTVFAIKGFFTDSLAVNLQILSDGFVVSGLMLLAFAGMLFISGEGGLIGIGFVLRNVLLDFLPMGRMKQEVYAKYRERKMKELKEHRDICTPVVGLIFFSIGVLFTVIWYFNFYC